MQMQILITVLGSRQTNRGRRHWYEHKDRAGYGSHNRRLALGQAKKPREPGKVGQQVRWWPGDGRPSSTPQFVVGLELAELVVAAGKVGSRK